MNENDAEKLARPVRIDPRTAEVIALTLMGGLLLAVLALHLLSALLTGLTVFVLHRWLTALLSRRMPPLRAHGLALSLVLLAIAATLTAIVFLVDDFGIGKANGALVRLTDVMSISLDRLRASLPAVVSEHLPDSVDDLRMAAIDWLRTHAADVRTWGTAAARVGAHLLVGLVIGLIVAGSLPRQDSSLRPVPPFLQAWRHGVARLTLAFSAVMGAQVRIAALNAILTAVYLFGVVPLLGDHVPLSKTLVAVTFVAGLLPVIGNLISNTAVVLTALVVSPTLALLSLLFLIAVHKFEYFLNARLIGASIQARTFELLTVMVLMEAVFGIGGVVAAPLYYAWLMGMLRDADWV